VGAQRAEVRHDSRPGPPPSRRLHHPASEEPEVNRFATWKPLKRFAAALDRPVGGTPVEDIVSEDRDR
jgi:hypothetical protein